VSQSTPAPSGASRFVPSPCVGICDLDDTLGRCAGCARTTAEIDGWQEAAETDRLAIWQTLPARLVDQGVNSYRLPAEPEDVFRFVETSLNARAGCWAVGIYGAVAEFTIAPDERLDVESGAQHIIARTGQGAVRFSRHDKAKAFGLTLGRGGGEMNAVALVLPRTRLPLEAHCTLTRCGADDDALKQEEREQALYDLGLGSRVARFCLRTGDDGMHSELEAVVGSPWTDAMAAIGSRVLEVSPVRVVETALVRAEIRTPIPAPGAASPDGPHTHLLPDLLAEKRETPPEIDLPPVFAPVAIFYPRENGWLGGMLGLAI